MIFKRIENIEKISTGYKYEVKAICYYALVRDKISSNLKPNPFIVKDYIQIDFQYIRCWGKRYLHL